MYKIEKGIPISPVKQTSKYPFDEMEKGDSFFVKVSTEKVAALQSSVLSATQNKFGPGVFKTRRVDGGFRVWRVK